MKRIGLVTCREFPRLSKSDRQLVEPLKHEGFEAIPAPWDDDHQRWVEFDALILRSCWNYPDHYPQFLDWIKQIEILGMPLFNSPGLVRWNIHKSYLFKLQKRGIPIIPITSKSTGSIVKPKIGNRGRDIHRSPKNIQALLATGNYFAQPFMEEAISEGEYSFVFIGGMFSHAVLKKQNIFKLIQPDNTLLRQAKNIIDAINFNLLYARVDGIRQNNTLLLMELELIEPQLFFDLYPPSATVFAKNLKKKLS